VKLTALMLVWLIAAGGVWAVAGASGLGLGGELIPPDDLPPELPESSPAIRCPLVPKEDRGAIRSVVYSRDGKTLIAGNMSGMLQWFDSGLGTRTLSRRVLNRYVGGIETLGFSPDGKILAALTKLGEVSLLDAATGTLRLGLEKFPNAQTFPEMLKFSPDGTLLASSLTSGEILLWDTSTGRRRAFLPAHVIPEHMTGPDFNRFLKPAAPANISSLAFTSDGHSLVSESGIVRTWGVNTGREVARWEDPSRGEYYGKFALAPDDSTLAMSHLLAKDRRLGGAGRLDLRDRASGRRIAQLPTQGRVNDLKFLPDGNTLVSLEDDRIVRLWDVATAQQLAAIRFDHHNNLDCLAVSPDGKWIAACGYESDPIFGIIYQLETDGSSLKLWKPQP